MSRLGLRQIRKPNVKGAAFVVDSPAHPSSVEQEKQVTNGVQTGNKETTQQVTNGVQTGNKESTVPGLAPSPQSDQNWKRVTERITSNRVNGVQTEYKQVTNLAWETLRGHEARLLHLIFDECRTTGDLLSPPITLDRIAGHLESRKGTAKTIIFRLTQKGFIQREASATGRGGFTRFRISKDLYQALLIRETEYKRVTNGVQTGNKEITQRVTEQVTGGSSSSSFLNLDKFKTTTTSEPELFEGTATQLAPEWQQVDCSPLSGIGFTQTHLVQIIRQGKLTPAEVQDSIHFFAFDLAKNGKGKGINGNPLNFFMGIVRKGAPYAPPENYESPEAEARRKYLDGKRRLEEQKLAEEKELRDLAFAEWRRGLTQAQANELVPDPVKDIPRAREASLQNHFEEQIWPELEAARLGVSEEDRQQVRAAIAQSLGEARG